MDTVDCKLLVVGAGPGGYICAIRAGQLGIDTVIVEEGKLGGTCLNVGCIPSKALIHAADEFQKLRTFATQTPLGISARAPAIDLRQTIAWTDGVVGRLNAGVAGLIKKAKVKLIQGRARFLDGKTVEVESDTRKRHVRAEAVVIATGSRPIELPLLPFGGCVISSTEALSLDAAPSRMLVVGGGYIGIEIGTAFAKLGSKVTIVEAGPRILPHYDAELTSPIVKRLDKLGAKIHVDAKVRALSAGGDSVMVETDNGEEISISADRILVTVGRRAATDGFALEELQLEMDRSCIRVDESCRTSMRGVYAVGDVTGEPMLAHRAMAQGVMVAEIIAGKPRSWDKQCVPEVCFTDPEIVSAGLSPEEAKATFGETKIGVFPFQANGRAMTIEREDGMVRVVARATDNVVLGIQAVGAGVAELAASFGLAIEMNARLEDIGQTIQAHPTLSEGFQEAALKALGQALHI